MSYSVRYSRRAQRDVDKLPGDIKKRIILKSADLRTDPRPHGCLKLKGAKDEWRVRVGEYRVIYRIDDSTKLVVVLEVVIRPKAYRG